MVQWLGLDTSPTEAGVQSLVRKVRSHKPHSHKKKGKERKRNCPEVLVLAAPGQPYGHAQLDGISEQESASLVQMTSLVCPLPRKHTFWRHVQDVGSDGTGHRAHPAV